MTRKEELNQSIIKLQSEIAATDELIEKNKSNPAFPISSLTIGRAGLQIELNACSEELAMIIVEEARAKNPAPAQAAPVDLTHNADILEQLSSKLVTRYNELNSWLDEHGNNCKQYNLQTQPNSNQRVYYNYGYMMALNEVLSMLGI